jgi:hypothetical protein
VSSLQRLKGIWQAEYGDWKGADLSRLELVYWWADGLYVKAGIAERKAALLVIVAATAEGEKVLLACQAGERERWCGRTAGVIPPPTRSSIRHRQRQCDCRSVERRARHHPMLHLKHRSEALQVSQRFAHLLRQM